MAVPTTIRSVSFRALQEAFPACDLPLHSQAPEPGVETIPLGTWLTLLEHLKADHLSALSPDAAIREIGRRSFENQLRGPMGSVLQGMVELGPMRFVARAVSVSQRYLDGGEWDVVLEEPGHLRCDAREVPIPGAYYAGFLEGALALTGAAEVAVDVTQGSDSFRADIHYRATE